jgi:hypothetical protein
MIMLFEFEKEKKGYIQNLNIILMNFYSFKQSIEFFFLQIIFAE